MRNSHTDEPLPMDEAPGSAWRRETALGAGAVLFFAASWIGASGACFALVDSGVGRFLDLPIGVFLAGQGLLMLGVVLAMRLFRA